MKAYEITNVKTFMAKLLSTDTFYQFLLEEGTITTFNKFILDGKLIKEFYSNEELETQADYAYEFSTWEKMQPICFSLIKGKNTPLAFQFVLHLKNELHQDVLSQDETTLKDTDIKAFVLNIRYQQGKLILTTATAFHTFLLDKSADTLWDQYIKHFLIQHNLPFEDSLS